MIESLSDNLSAYLQTSMVLSCVAAYIGGILVSFTPCVYPIAPITVAYVGAYGNGSRSRGFALSLLYVLGMAVTYAALGGIAALTGKLFGQIQANPWTNIFMANIFILMGLSMLDAFKPIVPRLPSFIARLQPRRQTKGFIGAFLVGIASALVVGPCTAPALAVLLGYAATSQQLAFAMVLLFVFALGMGTILVLLGTFAGFMTSLPKSGPWMNRISHLGGWIMLGMGEYFLIQAGMLWG